MLRLLTAYRLTAYAARTRHDRCVAILAAVTAAAADRHAPAVF